MSSRQEDCPPAAFDCRACGACCKVAGDVVVAPEEDVPPHLTRSVRRRVGFASFEAEDGIRIMARRACGSCAALSLRQGLHVCRIYECRPAVCREFIPGGVACRAARICAGFSAADV